MTDIDLIDWTVQEAQHLKDGRRELSDLDDGPSLEKLLTVLEREPAGPTKPEDPVAQIASPPATRWPSKSRSGARPVKPSPRPTRTTCPICRPSPRPRRRPPRRH